MKRQPGYTRLAPKMLSEIWPMQVLLFIYSRYFTVMEAVSPWFQSRPSVLWSSAKRELSLTAGHLDKMPKSNLQTPADQYKFSFFISSIPLNGILRQMCVPHPCHLWDRYTLYIHAQTRAKEWQDIKKYKWIQAHTFNPQALLVSSLLYQVLGGNGKPMKWFLTWRIREQRRLSCLISTLFCLTVDK